MSRRRRPRPQTIRLAPGARSRDCICGKRGYESRKDAKEAARTIRHRGDFAGHMSAYRCEVSEDLWHFGHLPQAVIEGRATRANIESPDRRLVRERVA